MTSLQGLPDGTAGPPVVPAPTEELLARARDLAGRGGRRLLGITGAPGAGKSTLAGRLVDALGPGTAVLVPMDGFHLAQATLVAWGREGRKGAWDTFDAEGYLHLLRRLRADEDEVVHAPRFDRDLEEPIGSALPVRRGVPLVVTEGNYLLSTEGRWAGVAALLDECWFVEPDESTRLDRLVARHRRHGRSASEAEAWAHGTDQVNARLVQASRSRADLVVRL